MANLEVNIIRMKQQTIYGVGKSSNDRTISKDINTLSKKYHAIVSSPKGSVLPYFVLSRNYNEQSRDFEMFIGSILKKNGLEKVVLPNSEYASVTIRPKLGFLWGISVAEAKRYFYTVWLPKSPYEALNLEYELHTEKSIGKHPTVDIIFAIKRK